MYAIWLVSMCTVCVWRSEVLEMRLVLQNVCTLGKGLPILWCCTPFTQADISVLKPGLHREENPLSFLRLEEGLHAFHLAGSWLL